MAFEQLPEELLLTIGDHLPNQPLRPCSRGLKSIFELPVDPKWRQYDPQRVCALWKSFLPIGNERCYGTTWCSCRLRPTAPSTAASST